MDSGVSVMRSFDIDAIRADFPILHQEVKGKPLVYLDSANTAQKAEAVIQAVDDFYRRHNANVSRAVHQLGSEATEAYEGARKAIAAFVKVQPNDLPKIMVFFRGNLFSTSW